MRLRDHQRGVNGSPGETCGRGGAVPGRKSIRQTEHAGDARHIEMREKRSKGSAPAGVGAGRGHFSAVPDDLIPLPRIAARLRTSASTLVRWSAAGEFPQMFKVGRGWLVRESDVALWLSERTTSRVQRRWDAVSKAARTHTP